MNKTKIIIIIFSFLLASFISEARAQGVIFEIPVNDTSILLEDKEKVLAYVPEALTIVAPQPPLAIEAKPIIRDLRTDFTAIYVSAGAKYGIDWQILAAVHSVETGQRGDTTVRSGAGAQGPMQFIPSTFRSYAQDGDGDGIKNINDVDDAIYTAANYLSQNMRTGGNIDYALYRYNHSYSYVNKVKTIASKWY